MEPMERMTGRDDKGSEHDEALHSSTGKKRMSPGSDKETDDSKGHDREKGGRKKQKKVTLIFARTAVHFHFPLQFLLVAISPRARIPLFAPYIAQAFEHL
jgi:hypothetical protein